VASWSKVIREGRTYLLDKHDASSVTPAIFANLLGGDDDETSNLIWTNYRSINGWRIARPTPRPLLPAGALERFRAWWSRWRISQPSAPQS
jgi:hypothetical protein